MMLTSYRRGGWAISICLMLWPVAAAAQSEGRLINVPESQLRECQSGKKSELCDLVMKSERTVAAPARANPVPTKAPAAKSPTPSPHDNPPIPPLVPVNTDQCISDPQGLFVRADPLDNINYLVTPQDSKSAAAKGLDVGYTNNRIASTQTATINGRVGYLLFGALCEHAEPTSVYLRGFGLAPFVSANGTWNEPLTKNSTSALKGGLDFQLAFATPYFPIREHFFYVSPYHQTDFRGLARIEGVTLAWEPVSHEFALDSGTPFLAELVPYLLFFWQLRPELDLTEVYDPGLTNLVKGSHAWLGTNVRANLALFPLNPHIDWPELIGGRFSFIGTAQNFYDSKTRTTANYYSAVVQYKLGACKRGNDPKDVNPCAIQGSSSISFEYDWGTNRDTLVNTNQYLVKLGFAY